jgi:hypothetical protein
MGKSLRSCTGYMEYPFQKYAADDDQADLLLLIHFIEKM